jgi:hypothetical protein
MGAAMTQHFHTVSEGCRNWLRAQQSGTDNEAYGRLLGHFGDDWSMGSDLDPIDYCPWCGASLSDDLVSKP